MIKLFCAIAGVAGSVFPVDIDASLSVGDLKDVIKAKKLNDLRNFDADTLQLFLAKMADHKWLSSSTEDVKKLKEGEKTHFVETLISKGRELQGEDLIAEFLADMETPKAKQIHVLVLLPRPGELKWESCPLGVYVYDSESRYFYLEEEVMDKSGLSSKGLLLYCRPDCHKQIKFLREMVLEQKHLGWILGPPGTGKSATAMAFALTVDRDEWEVIWIHAKKDSTLCWCIRMIGNERKTRMIDVTELKDMLQVDDGLKHRLVLVDGWTLAQSSSKVAQTCSDWYIQEKFGKKRRLAIICSLAVRGKIDEDTDISNKAMECAVYSWTLDEYLDATRDDIFFRDIAPYLDNSASDNRSALVEAKYYYAGGSCRYMFSYNTTDVMMKLDYALDTLVNSETAATIGSRSPLSVNRLFAMFKRSTGGVVTPVISRYAATIIAVRNGTDMIKKFMLNFEDLSNPALNGWMFEMLFFLSIRNGGLKIVDATGNIFEEWVENPVVVSDGLPLQSYDRPVWIKPRKWNQGGYDAVMVCQKNRLVRMVQVTNSDTHTFRIEYFRTWLEMLSHSDQSFEIDTLEIVFVVERKKLSDFRISTVTGEGMLEPFGWRRGTEANRAKKVGVQGLYNLSSRALRCRWV